jgi:hypothetical protein
LRAGLSGENFSGRRPIHSRIQPGGQSIRGRTKLVQLYRRGLPLGEAVVGEAAQRTRGVGAAFIKELMRRIAQASIARDGGTTVEAHDISEALDDMLFAGGKLNVKLLGGAQEMVDG